MKTIGYRAELSAVRVLPFVPRICLVVDNPLQTVISSIANVHNGQLRVVDQGSGPFYVIDLKKYLQNMRGLFPAVTCSHAIRRRSCRCIKSKSNIPPDVYLRVL